MKSNILTAAALLAALFCAPVAASAYHCEAAGASSVAERGGYRLLRDASGGSMGNPAQRSAFELRDAHTDATIARCPRGFHDGRMLCSGRTLGGAVDRFILERATGRYSLLRAGAPEQRGLCRSGRG